MIHSTNYFLSGRNPKEKRRLAHSIARMRAKTAPRILKEHKRVASTVRSIGSHAHDNKRNGNTRTYKYYGTVV